MILHLMKTISTILLFAFLFIGYLQTHAQFKQIAEGPKFEEPEDGYAKILQMKNGSTVYMHFTAKEGIDFRVYDASHAEKIATNFNLSIERVKEAKRDGPFYPGINQEKIESIFEINNDLIMFISEGDKNKSILYRIIIDITTGKIKEEKNIFTLNYGGYYVVKKDTYSENYAIFVIGRLETETIAQERLFHFGADHKEINNGICESPETDDAHSFFNYREMVILGPDRVCAFYFATSKKYDDKGNLYMVTLEKGSGKISYQKLKIPDDLIYREVIAKYNPVARNIVFLSLAESKANSGEFTSFINIIEPVTKKAENITDFSPQEKLNEAYKDRYDKKKDYSGLPQDLYINDDGSFSLVYEEMFVQYQQSGNYSRTDTKLGKMIITTHDRNGKFISNYMVPKAHWIIFKRLGLFYHTNQEDHAPEMWRGNQYKSFVYLTSLKGKYIFFNDTERNNEVKNDKFVEVQGVEDCDAFMYKLTGSDLFPKREYAFGETKKGHTLAMFSVSDYDKKTNTYVTLELDNTREKKVKIVWLQPE